MDLTPSLEQPADPGMNALPQNEHEEKENQDEVSQTSDLNDSKSGEPRANLPEGKQGSPQKTSEKRRKPGWSRQKKVIVISIGVLIVLSIAAVAGIITYQNSRTVALYESGDAYLTKNDLDNAIREFDKAIQRNPNYAEAYNKRGFAYSQKGEIERAMSDFDQALQIDPNYAEAYFNRGFIYSMKQESDRAMSDYDQAIQLNPDYSDAYMQRGIENAVAGDLDGAISDWEQVIRIEPSNALAYRDRGYAYYLKNDLESAIPDLEKAISLDSEDVLAFYTRGLTFAAMGNNEDAITDFNKVLESCGENITMCNMAQQQLEQLGASQPVALIQSDKPAPTPSANAITTESGLIYEDLQVGDGSTPKIGDTVSIHYTGWLADGTKFDSSLDRGQPFEFRLGSEDVIPGFDEGVQGMRVNGIRLLVIPPELAYGPSGIGSTIPPNATLTMEIQLVGIK